MIKRMTDNQCDMIERADGKWVLDSTVKYITAESFYTPTIISLERLRLIRFCSVELGLNGSIHPTRITLEK